MWQRFTQKAREVVFQAQAEAERYATDYVSSEHILLAVLAKPDTVGARVLEHLKVDFAVLAATVRAATPHGTGRTAGDMQLTDDAHRSIDFAYEESKTLGDNYIGSEHLVLGLIRDTSGAAGQALAAAGVDLESARRALSAFRNAPPPAEPTGVWQRFTERARRAVFFAQEEAIRLGGHQVAPEHLLLGMLRDDDTFADKVLNRLGVGCEMVRAAIDEATSRGSDGAGSDLQMTAELKHAIDLALDEARLLGDFYVGTEHLLLGLIGEEKSLAAQVLSGLGVNRDPVRRIVADTRTSRPQADAVPEDPAA